MFNENALKAEIIRQGKSNKEMAKLIGVSETTFWRKLKNGTFGIDEAAILVKELKIKNPTEIFFGKK